MRLGWRDEEAGTVWPLDVRQHKVVTTRMSKWGGGLVGRKEGRESELQLIDK